MSGGEAGKAVRRRLLVMVPVAAAAVMVVTLVGLSMLRGIGAAGGPVGEGGWTARSRSWFEASGLYPPELETGAMRHFTWTRTTGAFVIPAIDRGRAHVMRLHVRGVPPTPARAAQTLVLSMDGVIAARHVLTGEPQEFTMTIPTSLRTVATVGFTLSHGFVPGPADPRELGMIVDDVSIAGLDGWMRIAPRAMLVAALSAAAFGTALLLVGAPLWWTLALAVVGAAGQAWCLGLDRAFLGNEYVWRLFRFDVGLVVAAAAVRAVGRLRPLAPDFGLRTGLAIVLTVLVLRLAVFVHPSITVGDSIFQVHRAELVDGGHYFFTSITPRPFFEFPYAPGLYVAAMPFWSSVPDEADRVVLLRVIVLGADALAAIALFAAVRRYWGLPAACVAAGVYQVVPIGLHTICTSNLTNAFGQSVFSVALLTAVATLDRARRVVWMAVLAGLLTIGFLSHFSTLSTGIPIVLVAGVALGLPRADRRSGVLAAAALAVALLVAYAVYYSHFHEVYAKTLSRIASGEGGDQARSMVAPISVKVARFLHAVRFEFFGIPLAAGALVGAGLIVAGRRTDAWSRVALAWLIVVLGFFGLGILTPIEMRAGLALQPVVAALFGLAAAGVWARVPAGPVLATAAVGLVLVRGVTDWLLCLGVIAPPP